MTRRRNTRHRVLRILLLSKLDEIDAGDVARILCMSPSTLRRHLKAEHTSYQKLLDRVRLYRLEKVLARRWLPGKCVADVLGYTQTNSFYRAFGKWTGMTYTEYKKQRQRAAAPP